MKKIITAIEAAKLIKSEMTIMIGGFIKTGCTQVVIEELLKTETKDLTLISNDTSYPDSDTGKLIVAKRIKKVITSHIGTNPETGRQMNAGEIEVILTPQGTIAEAIRAGGAGLGGFLTPTGIGTIVEKGKEIMEIDGKKFILEKALKSDISLIYATKCDKYGNLAYIGSTRNFNPIMATAGKIVIVEVDEILDEPLDPNEIIVPGIYVDYIVKKGGN